MQAKKYELSSPAQPSEWHAYHDIRRRVLFDARGEAYDENHPDEHAAGNHPKLLKHQGEAIGVVRIDVAGHQAYFRRVAVHPNAQRRGHGRVLLMLAERFAGENGCLQVRSYVAPDAVDFYSKCGFAVEQESVVGPSGRVSVLMSKQLQCITFITTHGLGIVTPGVRTTVILRRAAQAARWADGLTVRGDDSV